MGPKASLSLRVDSARRSIEGVRSARRYRIRATAIKTRARTRHLGDTRALSQKGVFGISYVLNTAQPANPYSPQPNPATLSPAGCLNLDVAFRRAASLRPLTRRH